MSSYVAQGSSSQQLMQTNGQYVALFSTLVSQLDLAAATVAVTPGSEEITFSVPVTLPSGTNLQFSDQPGVTYVLAALGAPLALTTVAVATGSPNITFSAPVTFPAGTAFQFSDQPGTTYLLASGISGTAGVLTTAYTGPSDPAATALIVGGSGTVGFLTTQYTGPGDPAATVINSTAVITSPNNRNLEVVAKNGQAVFLDVQAFGAYAPTDMVLCTEQPDSFYCVGADNQPVLLIGVPANALVP